MENRKASFCAKQAGGSARSSPPPAKQFETHQAFFYIYETTGTRQSAFRSALHSFPGKNGMTELPVFRIRHYRSPKPLSLTDSLHWDGVDEISISSFRPESSDHRPRTTLRLQYTDDAIHGIFTVSDRYVQCVNTGFGGEVFKDSCVEFFVKPVEDKGYFNFEFNCGGSVLCSYITNPQRIPGGFREFVKLPAEKYPMIRVAHSMPAVVYPEIADHVEWRLGFSIPFGLLEKYAGPVLPCGGKRWRANFYKCGDSTSHPHWASWAPVDELNFHLPRCFGIVEFERTTAK
jgi:hypothetical protein